MSRQARAMMQALMLPILRKLKAASRYGLLVGLCAAGAHTAARADLWAYIDAKGIAHFSSEKVDDRYELFFKDEARAQGVPRLPGAPAASAMGAKSSRAASGSSKLSAFFSVSPEFKAVRHHMREAAQNHNVDFELLQAMIATESGFNRLATSAKGAVGLMQLMPTTASRYSVKADKTAAIEVKLTDPRTNIQAGARYLRDLMKLFQGKLDLVLAAYNAGEGAVQRYGNQIPPFKETQNYVATVMQLYTHLKPSGSIPHSPEALGDAQRSRTTFELRPLASLHGRANMVPALTGRSLPALAAVTSGLDAERPNAEQAPRPTQLK